MCITWVNFHAPFEHTEKLALGVGVPVPPLQTQACLSQSVLKAPCRGMSWSPCWVTVERRAEQLKFKTSYPREWMEGEPSPTDTAVVYPTKEKCLQWEREARSSPVERKLNPNPLGLPRLPQLPPLHVVNAWFDSALLSALRFYLLLAMYSFTFACSVLNKLTHSKLKAELSDYPPARTKSLWTQENHKLLTNYFPWRPVTKTTVGGT